MGVSTFCPRCRKRLVGTASPAASKGTSARSPVLKILFVLALAGLVVVMVLMFLRGRTPAGDFESLAARYSAFEGLPAAEVTPMLRAAHDECYASSLQSGFLSKKLDRERYNECVNGALGRRMARVATLSAPQVVDASEATSVKVAFVVDANEGYLAPTLQLRTTSNCPGRDPGESESATGRDFFQKQGDRRYRAEAVIFRAGVDCRYQLTLLYGQWPLGPALDVDISAPVAPAAPIAPADGPAAPTAPPTVGPGGEHMVSISTLMVRKAEESPAGSYAFFVDAILVDPADDAARNPLNASLAADCDTAGHLTLPSHEPVQNVRGMGTGKALISLPTSISLEKAPRECDITLSVRHAGGVEATSTTKLKLP